jgi:hypothetical protein
MHTPAATGTAILVITVTDPALPQQCASAADSAEVAAAACADSIWAWPSPFDGVLNVAGLSTAPGGSRWALTLFDARGREAATQVLDIEGHGAIQWRPAALAPGAYAILARPLKGHAHGLKVIRVVKAR